MEKEHDMVLKKLKAEKLKTLMKYLLKFGRQENDIHNAVYK